MCGVFARRSMSKRMPCPTGVRLVEESIDLSHLVLFLLKQLFVSVDLTLQPHDLVLQPQDIELMTTILPFQPRNLIVQPDHVQIPICTDAFTTGVDDAKERYLA